MVAEGQGWGLEGVWEEAGVAIKGHREGMEPSYFLTVVLEN